MRMVQMEEAIVGPAIRASGCHDFPVSLMEAGGVFGFSGKRLHEGAVLAHVGGVLPVLIRVGRGA